MTGKDTSKALTATRAATATLMSGLETTRQKIILKAAERLQTERAPVSQADAMQRLESWTASLDTSYTADMAQKFTSPVFRHPSPFDASELLAAATAEVIAAYLKKHIATVYETTDGFSADERRLRIAEINEQLLSLELAEESIIRAAEQSGFDILRRADADPRAVLAADESLP